MKWTSLVGLLALAIGMSGCATSAYRDNYDLPGERSTATPRTTRTAAPRQVHQTVPAQADDPAARSAATTPGRFDRFRLSHYLNPAARATLTPAPVPAPVVEVAARVPASSGAAAGRTSWFGLRRPATAATTYLTDARAGAGRSGLVPTRLPGLAPGLNDRVADRAVTTASVEGPAPAAGPIEDKPAAPAIEAAPAEAVAGNVAAPPLGDLNPDSSGAAAEPLRPDEPRLAVSPIAPPRSARPIEAPVAAPLATFEAAAPAAEVAATASSADATDPDGQFPERLRGRPRLASSSSAVEGSRGDNRAVAGPQSSRTASPAPARRGPLLGRRPAAPTDPGVRPTATDPEPAPDVIAGDPSGQPATAKPAEAEVGHEAQRAIPGDSAAVRAVPTPADPGRSLGLPEPVLPASYSKHGAGAARGSLQSAPTGPVLASPQVAATPQASPSPQSVAGSPGVAATAMKAKTKFCRFLRKCLCLDKKAKAVQ